MSKNNVLDSFVITEGSMQHSKDCLQLLPSAQGYVTLRLDGGMQGLSWQMHRYFILDMMVAMDSQALVEIYFEKLTPVSGEEPAFLLYEMVPNRRVKLVNILEDLHSEKFFLLTLPGMLKGRIRCNPSDISEMRAITIRFRPGYSTRFTGVTLYTAQLCSTMPDLTVQGAPMVDNLGQWNEQSWSGKMPSERAMVDYLREEHRMALETGAHYPRDWSQYGGWQKLQFEATGYFHTKHDGKRWWLVDPDGYAFFSNGICYGTRMGVHGFVDCMENLFSWLPDPADTTYSEAWTTADQIAEYSKRHGAVTGKSRRMFNFARANMIRAFGTDGWWDAWVTINNARLHRWGFNTLGVGVNNYVDERIMEFLDRVKIPFVWTLKNFPLTDVNIFRDFPDVFSEQYRKRSDQFAAQLLPFVGNPYLIGYFITNEPEWRFQSSVNLAERVFASESPLASKGALIALLREQYSTIEALNKAWKCNFTSFDSMHTPFAGADHYSETAHTDLLRLREVLLCKYAEVPHLALRAVDSDHMDLGMRYNKITENELAGSESFEVFSFNCYFPTPGEGLQIAEEKLNRPTMIGEWHIGGSAGLLSCGLQACKTQRERADACAYYMEVAMSSPSCTGLHYFEMNDQPLLGRFDGECMQHGIIDICNQPYPEMVAMFEQMAQELYPRVAEMTAPHNPQLDVYRAR